MIRKTLTRFSAFCFLLLLLPWPGGTGLTQITQPPPPPPAPGIPSIVENIRATRHNLTVIPPNSPEWAKFKELYGREAEQRVFTQGTTEVCVFCHTPHGASAEATQINAPLWNRNLSTARYTLYDQVWSTSFEAFEVNPPQPGAPTGYSRLCLSCHDGTIALGTVVNMPGSGGTNQPGFSMTTPPGGIPERMPFGSGPSTGDTRFIGTNLQNDHPISFVYDSALAHRDEELVDPGPGLIPPAKVGDPTPISPLRRYPGMDLGRFDSVQCTSCHNPHAATYPKFLRTSYFNNDPADPNYAAGAGKIVCLYCHDKPGWVQSSHNTDSFTPPQTPSQANPYNYDGTHTVGQYACRACHDVHTAQGAKRLLREGVDASNNFAIENTCFQCHKPASELANGTGTFPPDIRSEFSKDTNTTDCGGFPNCGSAMNLTLSQRHEPVFVARPQEGVELFSPAPPAFNEEPPGTLLRDTAHIECVDCHNPHQVIKTNRLKGMKGIDINGSVVGARIPGNSREPYVFEVCLRCHGNSYTNLFTWDRFPEDQVTVALSPDFCRDTRYCPNPVTVTYSPRSDPRAGMPTGGSQFSLKGFSNKRKEFDPKTPDMDRPLYDTLQPVNPSFHPVAEHGRNGTPQLCNQLAEAFKLDCGAGPGQLATPDPLSGFSASVKAASAAALSNLTIQCTDCHNNDAFEDIVRGPLTGLPDGTSYKRSATDKESAPGDGYNGIMQGYSVNPATPQGPHGSKYIRILRGRYNTDVLDPSRCFNRGNPRSTCEGDGKVSSHWNNFRLCFQCHDERAFNPYADGGREYTDKKWTNFFGVRADSGQQVTDRWQGNLHKYHLISTGAYCHECHYNVHSNIEAQHTQYGNGAGGEIPPDNEDGIKDGATDTHLLNFAPTVFKKNFAKPKWYYDSSAGRIGCDLICHNVDMSSCFYQVPSDYVRFCQSGSC